MVDLFSSECMWQWGRAEAATIVDTQEFSRFAQHPHRVAVEPDEYKEVNLIRGSEPCKRPRGS
jgi:hypothetical protein